MFSLFSSQKEYILKEMKKLERTLEIMGLYVDMADVLMHSQIFSIKTIYIYKRK